MIKMYVSKFFIVWGSGLRYLGKKERKKLEVWREKEKEKSVVWRREKEKKYGDI